MVILVSTFVQFITKYQIYIRPGLLILVTLTSALLISSCAKAGKVETTDELRNSYAAKDSSALLKEQVTVEEFPVWLKQYLDSLEWEDHTFEPQLSRDILKQSLALGVEFMIRNQKPEGNFNYQYDFVKKIMDQSDSQVRQAGALWALSLIYQYEPDAEKKAALDKGLRFFLDHTQDGAVQGSLVIAYPSDAYCSTGTVALVSLAIIEYLRTEADDNLKLTDDYRKELVSKLNGYIEHLKFMRLYNGHFSSVYDLRSELSSPRYDPYADGETLLCFVKAAKYLGHGDLIPLIQESAIIMAKNYTIDQWNTNPDSNLTKGFYQWSSMAFWEYQDAGWENSEFFADYVLALAWWMIHTHNTLALPGNTAYAYEGIIHAYLIAKERNHEAALGDLSFTIDQGLYKLTSWQVGGPLQAKNEFPDANYTNDPIAIGGIIDRENGSLLRIDIVQHQMHAVILALRYVYEE
jgi:hypothetical protein